MILAKPTLNISLQEHTNNVISEARAVLASWPYVVDKYRSLTGKDLQKRVVTAATYHDVGKEHPDWQGACQKDHEIFQRTHRDSDMFHLRNANFRHEIASLLDPKLGQLSDPVKVAIAAHHGKLAEDAAHRWKQQGEISLALWSHFKGIKNKVTRAYGAKDEKLRHAILSRYEFSGPRALLQLADHRASARESSQPVPDWKSFEYSFPFDSKRGVQSLVDDFKDQPFTVLRAPTGSGKTDTALLWAQHQINMKRADRLVIAMPTRFTSNSLAVSISKNLSQTGLYHSSAWFERIKNKAAPSKEDRDWIIKEQALARLFATPITVSTIDHLCISLTGTREDHHAIFFNLAHSSVVIDESDFYDELTELNIVVLLKVLRILKVPVLLMSATVPDSSLKTFATAGFKMTSVIEDKSDSDRLRYAVKRIGSVNEPVECQELLKKGFEQPLIIYANTVARAQNFYKWFLKENKTFCEENVILYHSRFTEPDKVRIESQLIDYLGKQAWKNGRQKGVAILTQIGELSVNISANMMISDLCPVDRLTQRAGRLSRFSEVVGHLFVIDPMKDNRLYPAPYGSYSRNGWISSGAFTKSAELLKDGHYSSAMLINMVNRIYATIEFAPEDRAVRNQEELEQLCIDNWLILPSDRLDEDDDHTFAWKSRDIDAQYTVFVNFDLFEDTQYLPNRTALREKLCTDKTWPAEQYLPNRTALREFQILHGVQCYAYEFNAAKESGFIKQATMLIGDDLKVSMWFVGRKYYDSKMGLHFD